MRSPHRFFAPFLFLRGSVRLVRGHFQQHRVGSERTHLIVAGVHEPSGKTTLFVAKASGGVWKTDDSGTAYSRYLTTSSAMRHRARPEEFKNLGSAPVKRGHATACPLATGIYKSTDGGETWSRAGLEKSERIGQIAVDPRNSDTVFAAPARCGAIRPTAVC